MKKMKRISFIICLLILISIGLGFIIEDQNKNLIAFPKLNVKYEDNIIYIDKPGGCINIFNSKSKSKSKSKKMIDDNIDETGILIFNKKIYYISETTKNVCSIDINGENKRVVGLCNVKMPYQPMFILNNTFYYYNSNNILVSIDSKEKTKMIPYDAGNKVFYHITANSLIDKEYLYYWDDSGVYKMGVSDQRDEMIGQQYVYDKLYADVDEKFYYIDNKDYFLHSMDKSGNQNITLSNERILNNGADFDSGNLQIEKDFIFFTTNKKLYKLNKATNEKEAIINNVSYFVIIDQNIYFMSEFDNGKLYKFNFNSGKLKLIAKGDFIPYIEVVDHFVFYGIKSKDDYLSGQGEIAFAEI